MNETVNNPDSISTSDPRMKISVWRMMTLYPTLFVAILGALPTFKDMIKSFFLDVPWNQVHQAQDQFDLMRKNISCMAEAASHPLKTHDNVSISAAVCDSGDVAIVAQNVNAGSFPNPVIVPLKSIVNKGDVAQASVLHSLLPIDSAYAFEPWPQPVQSPEATVICQHLWENGNLLRRMKLPSGQCIDVLSNVYTRKIIKQTPAACTPTCA